MAARAAFPHPILGLAGGSARGSLGSFPVSLFCRAVANVCGARLLDAHITENVVAHFVITSACEANPILAPDQGPSSRFEPPLVHQLVGARLRK